MKIIQLSLLSIAICISQYAMSQQEPFTGKWALNKTNSEFGIAPVFVIPKEITLSLTKDSLRLTFINLDAQNQEQPATTGVYAVDGSAFITQYNDSISRRASVKVLSDGRSFTRSMIYYTPENVDQPYRSIEEKWTVSADGRTLVFQQSVLVAGGTNYDVKGVYDKIQ